MKSKNNVNLTAQYPEIADSLFRTGETTFPIGDINCTISKGINGRFYVYTITVTQSDNKYESLFSNFPTDIISTCNERRYVMVRDLTISSFKYQFNKCGIICDENNIEELVDLLLYIFQYKGNNIVDIINDTTTMIYTVYPYYLTVLGGCGVNNTPYQLSKEFDPSLKYKFMIVTDEYFTEDAVFEIPKGILEGESCTIKTSGIGSPIPESIMTHYELPIITNFFRDIAKSYSTMHKNSCEFFKWVIKHEADKCL